MRFARFAAASAALTIAVGGFAASTSFADPPPDSLLEANPTAVTVNVYATPALGDPAHTATVTVGLDSNCSNAIEATKYSIVPGSSAYVSVSPAASGLLKCGQTATFTVTGVAETPAAPPASLLHFSALAKNTGLQKKIGGTDITIVVVDTTPEGGGGCEPNCPPVNEGRPAAPAIANGLLNTIDGLAGACKSAFNNAKNWRGQVISSIADQMPKPESVKDTDYTEAGWTAFVKYDLGSFVGLYGLCDFTGDPQPAV